MIGASVTGTPIEQNDANTRAVFGEYVSVYDIQQAVIDKATVPIYYESRIAKLSLNEAELPKVDSEFEEITEGEEEDRKQKLKTKWAALEALVGSEKRIRLIAEDWVQHFERQMRTYRHQPECASARFEPGLAPRGSYGELHF